jgi:hypothetical protein
MRCASVFVTDWQPLQAPETGERHYCIGMGHPPVCDGLLVERAWNAIPTTNTL